MKFLASQMAFFLRHQSNRRNLRFVLRLALFLLLLIAAYSAAFHSLMAAEGRSFSPLTGLYWTLTVMSTLGFGDITFAGDAGRLFSLVVLLSGVLFFMLVLPFTFIRFVFAPWLEAKASAMTPRELPAGVSGHLVVVGTDVIALSIVERCQKYAIPHVLLVEEEALAIELFDAGCRVVLGPLDAAQSYRAVRAGEASLVLALHDDLKNTNIAATLREVSSTVPLAASINLSESADILALAGCTHVIHFARKLGEGLARRVFNAGLESNIIGRFEGLCIAESPARHTPFVGKCLAESGFRSRFGLNVAGILRGNHYLAAGPDSILQVGDVILLAGSEDRLRSYDAAVAFESDLDMPPVLILGGGRVGTAVAETLKGRSIPFRLVEQNPALIPEKNGGEYILGNAARIDVLVRAGIEQTHTVVVTTHNDDLNIYLTIYCRKLRPDIQIISRATRDRNVASLYNAGANLVMSHASLAADIITNLLIPGRVFMLTEGCNIFRLSAPPPSLVGIPLRKSRIREDTDCTLIAVRNGSELRVPPDPDAVIRAEDEFLLIGAAEAEKAFMEKYC
ncbi:MAG: NAD-binding protein [Desulfovibrio sp.]|nr:NAD-binding protein [Desulfovibrio sp.]